MCVLIIFQKQKHIKYLLMTDNFRTVNVTATQIVTTVTIFGFFPHCSSAVFSLFLSIVNSEGNSSYMNEKVAHKRHLNENKTRVNIPSLRDVQSKLKDCREQKFATIQ